MSKYSREDLISYGIDEENINDAIHVIQSYFIDVQFFCVIFNFYEAPEILRKVFCLNGGDEDWLIITNLIEEPDWLPRWIAKTDSCETPDVYLFENSIVYVGSHA